MDSYTKKLPSFIFPMIGCILAAIFFVIALYNHSIAESTGDKIGQETGFLVGRAAGSYEGMTKGREEGLAAGTAAGLSAEDTEAAIANEIHRIDKLEVLVASVKISDFHTIGEEEKLKYAALYLLKGEVVFSVDLNQADIVVRDNEVYITIPKPHGELYIDQSRVEKAAEYQRHYFSGSAEDGFDAFLNSMKKVTSTSVEELENYSVLLQAAQESAKKQVKQLASSVAVSTHTVNVDFKEG